MDVGVLLVPGGTQPEGGYREELKEAAAEAGRRLVIWQSVLAVRDLPDGFRNPMLTLAIRVVPCALTTP